MSENTSSYFDGKLHQLIGWTLLSMIITIFTLGICFPWGTVMKLRWKTNHTVINGHRLKFNGTGAGLFGNWIKWLLLSIITLGIYLFWVKIKMIKWRTKNTSFAS